MQQSYINPNEVAIIEVVNHRETNYDYIDALTDSMKEVGFSIEYPIDVFSSENIPNHNLNSTTTPYVVACGVHRTLASQKAGLDKVFANIHEGGEEAWIEMMHTDNFQFDPAENRDIGQPFTPKERRAACTQLLMLPKFYSWTNTLLADAWNTSEANIRRWRKEVEKLLENPEQIQEFGISDGRIKRLKELMNSNERLNGSGETVAVRKPKEDAPEDEKEKFFSKIRKDHDEIYSESTINFEWEDVRRFASERFNVEYGWSLHKDLHIDQLRKLHVLLLEKDADMFSACEAIYSERKEILRLKDEVDEITKKTKRVFSKLIQADNEWDDRYKSKFETFSNLVKSELQIETFGDSRYDYFDYRNDEEQTIDALRGIIDHHEAVQEAIKNEDPWIAKILKKWKAAGERKRKQVSENWTETRQAVIDAVNNYDRDVSFDRIIAEAENKLYKSTGYFTKIFDAESVSGRKDLGTLEDEIQSMKKIISAIESDSGWVADLPEAMPLIDVITENLEQEESESTSVSLSDIPLEDIFQHVVDRVVTFPGLCDEMEVMVDLAQVLSKASKGMTGHQLYLLAKQALFILAKSDENSEIEKASPNDEGVQSESQ